MEKQTVHFEVKEDAFAYQKEVNIGSNMIHIRSALPLKEREQMA